MKKWLITGGCGFIGTRLIEQLVRDKRNHICVVDNLSVGAPEDLSKVTQFSELVKNDCKENVFSDDGNAQCKFVEGDILDSELAIDLASQANIIVHLAANTGVGPSVVAPREDCNINVIGTLNYLEGARHADACKFVFASSGAPLGEVDEPPIHEKLPANPVSPYGASKLAGEGYCSAYYSSYGIDTVALRFGNVYGPGSEHKDSVVAKFIKKAINGEALEIYGNGSQTRDFIFIDDLVDAIIAATKADGVGGEKYQIATNRESTVAEMVETLKQILEKDGFRDVLITHSKARIGDVMRNFSDISKAKSELGWMPKYDLKQGLESTVRYFNEIKR